MWKRELCKCTFEVEAEDVLACGKKMNYFQCDSSIMNYERLIGDGVREIWQGTDHMGALLTVVMR